ncbi:MAG: peptidylprolyl isomerase [Planctomycetes bacterium]|nr:peptidylprolyl isomerase [Planctomycetota bacterium]
MPTRPCRAIALSLLALPWAAPARSQAPTPPEPPHFVVRSYPRDRDEAIARVGDRTLTLGMLVDHIDARHYPGFRDALEKHRHIQLMLESDLVAPWVRQFADLEALQQTFADEIDQAKLEAAQSESLRKSFQAWLDNYVADLKANNRPTELTQQRVNSLLADFQLRQGIAAELQGMLELLEPGEYTTPQLRQFFEANARTFGGRVSIQHILVQHRDAGTGILLADEGLARANARLADVKARLRKDGSNFEEVARGYSDDTRTAKEGGLLANIARFDDRLPAALCRTAWQLRDGEVSDVVETQYGWHLVKRIEFTQHVFILFTDDAIPAIRQAMVRQRQEDRLFHAREQTKRQLLL